ncbi:MAG: ABC transporter permease subunit [Armatimonadetes bacterium]|nr:ABC transporter permease subunit [Armatimonadota bacterium]
MMEGYLISATLKDLLRLPRALGWTALVIALFGLSKVYFGVLPNGVPADAYNSLSSLLVYRAMMLAAAIFSASIIAQEIEQKTIVYLLTRPIPRATLLTSRLIAVWIVVAAVSILALLAISLAIYGADAFANPYFFRDVKGILAGAVAYSTLFTFTSLLMNRSMLANLIFCFGWETAVTNMTGNIYKLSVFTYLKAIAEKPSTGGQNMLGAMTGDNGLDYISPTTGWVTIGVLTAVLLFVARAWFTKFSYLPREDAE